MKCIECNDKPGSLERMGYCVHCYDDQRDWLWAVEEADVT